VSVAGDDELGALIVRRDELQLQHEAAVALLERQGPDRAIKNRRAAAVKYDELAAVQREIYEKQKRGDSHERDSSRAKETRPQTHAGKRRS
jgi:hypothetical protein